MRNILKGFIANYNKSPRLYSSAANAAWETIELLNAECSANGGGGYLAFGREG